MRNFEGYLAEIEDTNHRNQLAKILSWVCITYPELETRVAWNQPMFTHHGTFILAFSVAKQHIAVAPEKAGMLQFQEAIEAAGYTQGKMLFRLPFDQTVNYELLQEIIEFNMEDKKDCTTFWRKS